MTDTTAAMHPSGRRSGRRALALGAAVALAALIAGGRPFVPVYDGVVPVPPYRWLDPPPGALGSPQGATAKITVSGGSSPLVAVATPEDVPQAQVFAIPGGLVLPAGSTRLDVSIEAIQPPAAPPPTGQVITGNVYAVLLTNQSGAVVTANPSAEVSIVLRAPDVNQLTASVARFDGTAWQVLGTTSAGVGATFEGVVTQFGEFALLAAPPAPTAAAGPGSSAAGAPSPGESASEATAPSGATTSGPSSPAVESPAASPIAAPAEGDRTLLALGLGAVAVIIVLLVGVFALAPRRRPPPPARRNRR